MPALAEDIIIDRRLLALPYKLEVSPEGRIIMTALHEPAPGWEELATTHPILPEDLGWKIETNARNQIIMSPPPHIDHQDFGSRIIVLLARLLPEGSAIHECGVKTTDGTKVPDIIWVSKERRRENANRPSFSRAPELCVEIISPSNTRREIEDKTRLYFEAGAREVWQCERGGRLCFFDPSGPIKKSLLCPEFPDRLDPFA
jgi:Uma2 family endonuclease